MPSSAARGPGSRTSAEPRCPSLGSPHPSSESRPLAPQPCCMKRSTSCCNRRVVSSAIFNSCFVRRAPGGGGRRKMTARLTFVSSTPTTSLTKASTNSGEDGFCPMEGT
ncbi:hypothetical protein L226DRAFT_374117 [Lentinus tigrinus ALCF2SS1-7]|uniref:Uncharacterized protein n=1 Tax=Lentinus tigrinus ALCF2SS1-6 TaxID=1328759 RepID=A0A5C2SKH9_9APHY|nr:hypothetical protein L227DRAFT_319589 [Lentinus tigrinus ALCF2SS1-6]RPD76352.1 hypothetical protein L226DRAFT_374117 [Lentinus tigrinus ALCF2SS1-7]